MVIVDVIFDVIAQCKRAFRILFKVLTLFWLGGVILPPTHKISKKEKYTRAEGPGRFIIAPNSILRIFYKLGSKWILRSVFTGILWKKFDFSLYIAI